MSDTLLAAREPLDRALHARWRGQPDPLDRVAGYALVPAGKMIRPVLTLEAVRCVGGVPEDVAELALAVEYLHVASLVHDDIIDGDGVRRGRPSVPAAFGIPAAVVAGDGMILHTFATLAARRPAGVPDGAVVAAVAALAEAGLGLCRGQLLEAELTGDLTCPVDRYLAMVELKTGALFEAACGVGAILGGGRAEWVEALSAYGRLLGSAFQIRDDLLGFDGAAAPTGKPQDSDLRNRRPTLPVLLAHRRAPAEARRRLEELYRGAGADGDPYAELLSIVASAGGREAAEDVAAEVIARARACLAVLPPGPGVTALEEFADYASGRRF